MSLIGSNWKDDEDSNDSYSFFQHWKNSGHEEGVKHPHYPITTSVQELVWKKLNWNNRPEGEILVIDDEGNVNIEELNIGPENNMYGYTHYIPVSELLKLKRE